MKSLTKLLQQLSLVRVSMVLSGGTEIVKPDSHYVVSVIKVMQKDPKNKDSEFESFVNWVFLHDSKDSRARF